MNLRSFFILLSVIVFTSCGSDDSGGTITPQDVVATIAFSITTDTNGKPATITYTDAGSSEATLNNQSLPWNLTFTGTFNAGETVVLNAVSTVPGDMTATLSVNGVVVATGTDEDEINLSAVVN